MPSKTTLSAEQRDRFRDQLRELRDRLLGDVDTVTESIREEINPTGDLSNVPTHLADSASGQLDAEIYVSENERGLLQEVQGALHRLDAGTFGTCIQCGKPVALERLEVIPYAARCIRCAQQDDQVERPLQGERQTERRRLRGFEAIEFAEKEGLALNKAADAIDGPAHGLSVAEAEAIASDNPELIWVDVAEGDYGVRKNMRPGR